MERDYSVQSLPSRGGSSEIGSTYTSESGIYMSSFAAAIFIFGFVTVGVSLLSLLVAMAVMLRSCESKNSGFLETYVNINNYDYCRNFALHAELNNLGAGAFPEFCKDVNILYIKEGLYMRDLNITVSIAEDFFSGIKPQNDGRDVVMMDADDFLASETLYTYQLMHRISDDAFHDSLLNAEYLKNMFVKKLYIKLQSGSWSLILLSRKPEKIRDDIINRLISVGCHGWSSLIMRKEDEMQIDFQEFSSMQRATLQRNDFRITAVISSKMDALKGSCLGNRSFKLPNPIFKYNPDGHIYQEPI